MTSHVSKNPLRPRRADGEATRWRILEEAGKLIAVSGFAETSSKSIAQKAGVDLASINYHFGSRAGLYQAVLAEAHSRLISMKVLTEVGASGLPARDKLRKVIESMVKSATSRQSWHTRVLGRELLSPSSHLAVLQTMEVLPKVQVVLTILSEITGLAPDDPALSRCLISVGAPCAMLLVVGRHATIFSDIVTATPKEILVEHLYHFALGGLEAIARKRSGHPLSPAVRMSENFDQ